LRKLETYLPSTYISTTAWGNTLCQSPHELPENQGWHENSFYMRLADISYISEKFFTTKNDKVEIFLSEA
jgi:hypothetical protein